MNDFTKEELEYLMRKFMLTKGDDFEYNLHDKLESMIENYSDEKEVFSCYTGLAVSDDFFCKQQHMTKDDLLPALHQLATQCDGMIKSAGIYAFKLRLVRMK